MKTPDPYLASRPVGGAAIVTDATSGIGRAIAERLAASGYGVCVNHKGAAAAAADVVREIEWNGGRAVAVSADVSQEGDIARLFDEAARVFGRVDLLVANAGMRRDVRSCARCLPQGGAVIESDFTAQYLCCREAVRRFRARVRGAGSVRAAGSIVMVGAMYEAVAWSDEISHATAKAGTATLMRMLAREVTGEGIRINCIVPGAIRTPVNLEAWGGAAAQGRLSDLVPYGRFGEPQDVAEAVAWLASDAADYVVGTTLNVDGGMSLRSESWNVG